MLPSFPVAVVVTTAVLLLMLVELQLSVFNERVLRARGAIEPPDDVYKWMRVAWPAAFVLMGLDAALGPPLQRVWVLAGLLLFGWAKVLKFWAISHLRSRWTFRVLVLPGEPLVTTGPYRYMRHPNYLAVMGELVSIAIALQTPIAGIVSVLGFGWLIKRRIAAEERALGGRTTAHP